MTSDTNGTATQANIGFLCTRAQVERGLGAKTALRWITPALERVDYSFNDLEEGSNRVANLIRGLGCRTGERVFLFLPKTPELYFAFLGILKLQAVASALFPNFGPEALLDRLSDAAPVCVITRKSLLKRVLEVLPSLPSIRHVLVTDLDEDASEQVLSYKKRAAQASPEFETPPTVPETPSILHYTSGSTGKPKGALHVHGSAALQMRTARDVLGLKADDIYWCTADPGWVTGVSYGIIGPWGLGITQVQTAGGYDAEAWLEILRREDVNVWYTAPTALRMLRQEDPALFEGLHLPNLRAIYSVGEPLNPEVLRWTEATLGKPVYDTWFQTETGSIMIANRSGLAIKPGSMGQPVSGIQAAILDEDGRELPDGQRGSLCLQAGWESMFIDYWNHPDVYAEKFRRGWYITGDTAYRDAEGYFWFTGRSDDVINTAGHLVSPFEIESGLLEIAEIGEAGVIGAPDELLFEKVVAFIALKKPLTWSKELELKIRIHIGNHLSSIAVPQEFRVVESIPKNKSGKIMRRVLKAWYMEQDAGDLSTLEV